MLSEQVLRAYGELSDALGPSYDVRIAYRFAQGQYALVVVCPEECIVIFTPEDARLFALTRHRRSSNAPR